MVVFTIIFLIEEYVAKWSYKALYLLLLSMFLIFVWTYSVSFSFICKFTFILLLSFWILCVARTWVNVYVELLACKVDVQHPLPPCSHCFCGRVSLWTWSSPVCLDWLTSVNLSGPRASCPLSGVTVVVSCLAFP